VRRTQTIVNILSSAGRQDKSRRALGHELQARANAQSLRKPAARHHVKHGLPHCAVLIRWVDQVTTLHVLALDIYVARLPVVDSDRCREQSAVDWLPLRSRSHLIVRRNQSNVTTPSPRQIKTSSMSLGGHLPTRPRVLDCAAIRFQYLPACRAVASSAPP
jgi:hypothetical protein